MLTLGQVHCDKPIYNMIQLACIKQVNRLSHKPICLRESLFIFWSEMLKPSTCLPSSWPVILKEELTS